jgi:hypothetical protein
MKNIVLYIFISLVPLLTGTQASGQKPAIDLLPTNHQNQHPEAKANTIPLRDSVHRLDSLTIPAVSQTGRTVGGEIVEWEKPRTGWQFDSFSFKRDSGRQEKKIKSGNQILFFKYIKPLQFFIQITALK